MQEMSLGYPDPAHSARRNLAQRIDRFIGGLERSGRAPTVYEAERTLSAIVLLAHSEYREGEDAMMHAERPDLAAPAEIEAPEELVSTHQLRDRLSNVVREFGDSLG